MEHKHHPDLPPDLKDTPELDLKHTAWTALDCIADNIFTPEEALKVYQLTPEQLEQHRQSWLEASAGQKL